MNLETSMWKPLRQALAELAESQSGSKIECSTAARTWTFDQSSIDDMDPKVKGKPNICREAKDFTLTEYSKSILIQVSNWASLSSRSNIDPWGPRQNWNSGWMRPPHWEQLGSGDGWSKDRLAAHSTGNTSTASFLQCWCRAASKHQLVFHDFPTS